MGHVLTIELKYLLSMLRGERKQVINKMAEVSHQLNVIWGFVKEEESKYAKLP